MYTIKETFSVDIPVKVQVERNGHIYIETRWLRPNDKIIIKSETPDENVKLIVEVKRNVRTNTKTGPSGTEKADKEPAKECSTTNGGDPKGDATNND